MRIGIISDTHGKLHRVQRATEVFAPRQLHAIVHCGDIGSEQVLERLAATGVAVFAVAGNVDHHLDRLTDAAGRLGIHFNPVTVEVQVASGRYLVATHGHRESLLDELIVGGQFPYVCHGHTHRVRSEHRGEVRIINPGALHHPKSPRHPTVAVLDTDADTIEHLPVEK
jgi:hypothetical protein